MSGEESAKPALYLNLYIEQQERKKKRSIRAAAVAGLVATATEGYSLSKGTPISPLVIGEVLLTSGLGWRAWFIRSEVKRLKNLRQCLYENVMDINDTRLDDIESEQREGLKRSTVSVEDTAYGKRWNMECQVTDCQAACRIDLLKDETDGQTYLTVSSKTDGRLINVPALACRLIYDQPSADPAA